MEEVVQTPISEEKKEFFDNAQMLDRIKSEQSSPSEDKNANKENAWNAAEAIASMSKDFAETILKSTKDLDNDEDRLSSIRASLLAFFVLGLTRIVT